MRIKEYIKRIKEYTYDSSISLKDRSFVIFSFVLIGELLFGAIPSGIIMHEPLSSTLSTLLGAIVFSIYVASAIRRKKIARAKIVVTIILVFIFLPLMFFTNGGVYSGVPVSLLLGGLYINMILDGKLQIIMNILYSAAMIVCWMIGYYNPELIIEYDRKGAFIDSILGLLIVNAVVFVLLSFHTKLYEKENRIAGEKTKELEEMNKAQNRFFSSMSHEIRTPINTVLGMNEIILRQEDASEEIRKDARNIQGAGKMLLALINDILDVSKIEAGKMDIVPVNYSVSSLLSEIVNMIWLKAEEKGLKFNVDIDPDVPETLFGDEVRIKQILINLLNNAVKYTPEGSVSLHMECEFPDSGEALLVIQISDTGMGIKPEALPHLFDTFQRVDEEKNRYIEGTGLGLSIVKQLVELMGGEISVNSVYSQGSTFMVTLKQGVSSDKIIGDLSITGNGGMSNTEKFEHSFHAPDARILIVDDNEMNLQVEKKLLAGTDMTIDLALSGQDALSLTLQNRYDVIFMDHLMPEMDGIDCYEKIRTQKGGMNVNAPIIVLTANAGGENIELYNNTGFDGYLVKPVSGSQLEEMLLMHLPSEKIIGTKTSEMTGSALNTASRYSRKKPVLVATSTMIDLPQHVLRDLNVSVIPYTVTTDEGVFYDTVDIDSEELVRYMKDETKGVTSDPPTEDDLVAFFSSELKKAHHLIYITLTTGSSREYGRAVKAAKTFDNVTVINSETLSSGTGILVMIAARLAQQNLPVEKIKAELEEAKQLIRCSFVIKSTDVMARRERISPFMNSILNALWLRPMLRVKKDKLGVGRFLFGSEKKCYAKYIEHAVPSNIYPDRSFVFITYAGMDEDDLLWIEEKLNERMKFEHVIFQKASAGITSNCGEGTFGILYIVKGNHNYNLGSLFTSKSEEGDFLEEADDETEDVVLEDSASDDVIEPDTADVDETKWYENIDGLDAKAAIQNSGSEEAMLSVLRMFYDSYEAKAGELQHYFDTKDWENYTIKVHALKSGSRLVGVLKLGDKAEALEMAGKRSDIDFIMANHQDLMDSYRTIRDDLEPMMGSDEDLPDIPEDILEDAYAGLSEFAYSKDYELARMVMDSVREYRLPEEDKDRFDRIQNCLSVMDWDGISSIISEKQ
ncbi:MAG: DegV family EDD domain-containing protein [Lachnospiraceae bacterium]|nr:DegV family EDD domain-containing protein [Lachnospiraceae bacterium]